MKKILPHILIVVLLVGVFMPHETLAAGWLDVTGNVVSIVLIPIGYLLLQIMSLILWIAGVTLNFVIQNTVVTMSSTVAGFTGINIAWKVVRDLLNIGFIFLLIYEGIKLIVSESSGPKVRDFVVGVVITAILINFSLFFTKLLIDASNVVTIGFYNSIIDNSKKATVVTGTGANTTLGLDGGLSVPFMNSLRLQSIFSPNTFSSAESASSASGGATNNLIIDLAGCILFLITAFIFLAVACMFVIRYVVLLALMMLSPVAFVWKDTIPGLKKIKDDWWDSLKGQLLFGPIYMLLTWVVLTLIASDGFIFKANSSADWGKFLTGGDTSQNSLSLVFNFAIVIGLTIFSLVQAKKWASMGSDMIGKATANLTSFAGDKIVGGVGTLGRATVGRTADRLTRSKAFQKYAGETFIGKQLYQGTTKIAGSSFDARNTAAVKKATGTLGIDFGKGSTDTYGKKLEQKTKEKLDFGKSLDLSKEGREAYIANLAGHQGILSPLYAKGGSNNSKRSLFGTLGRSNRMAAASLLKDRIKEATTELNALRSEENALTKAAQAAAAVPPTGPALTATETARLAQLLAPATTPGSILEKSDEIVSLKAQVTTLELQNTQKQKY